MDAADLRVFEAVARLGGMNRAAAELHTVQSNVTARIRLLEDELGLVLFHRHSRGVALTPAGQRLLPYAGRVRQVLAEARRAVADDGTPRGPLVVGSLETTAGLRLPPLLAAYAEACPEVDLSLVTGTTAELVDAVLSRKTEGAFVCGPVRHPDIDETPVFAEELVVVTGRNAGGVDEALHKSGLKIVVFRAGCSYRQILEAWLARRGIVGARMLEFGTLEGILGCVAAGIGVSLLPEAIVLPAVRVGRIAIHRLAPAEARVETVFIRRRDHHISSALSAFLSELPSLSLAAAAE
jgi:LysR family transcriptional regulator, cell division regulator